MVRAFGAARGDDSKKVRYDGIPFITPIIAATIEPPIDTTSGAPKDGRGLVHPLTAKLLCPHRWSALMEEDMERYASFDYQTLRKSNSHSQYHHTA